MVENATWKLMDIVNKQTGNEYHSSISRASEFVVPSNWRKIIVLLHVAPLTSTDDKMNAQN